MGVYHLMGLGRSAGAVTGPISYLAERYQRWNEADQLFFSRSGEQRQRQAGQKVGDIQAIVLFTTREVLEGAQQAKAFSYIENTPGKTIGAEREGGPMKDVLVRFLKKLWPQISGGRKQGSLFWCEIDRRDLRNVYSRVIRVVSALGSVGGGQGHEMWINLTGGNNVTNFALELAASLTGRIARMYYVQAQDQNAEKCIFHTAADGYWVELPVLPLALSRLRRAMIQLLTENGPLSEADLFSLLWQKHAQLVEGMTSQEVLHRDHLAPMWRQGLLEGDRQEYSIGPQWEIIQPYVAELEQTERMGLTIEQLARQEGWITHQKVELE